MTKKNLPEMKVSESSSPMESSAPFCPICMEELDPSDQDFFPCPCDYQVCPWCLAYINDKLGGKCPACRQEYNESLYRYVAAAGKPTTTAKAKRCPMKKNFKGLNPIGEKSARKTTNESNHGVAPTHIQGIERVSPHARVIKKNLVYIMGIPVSKINKEELMSCNYFGRYGTISNLVLCKSRVNFENPSTAPESFSAFITYASEKEAQDCISAVDGSTMDNCTLRAYVGTTKYCIRFLRGQKCTKPSCFYLHSIDTQDISVDKRNSPTRRHDMSTSHFKKGSNEKKTLKTTMAHPHSETENIKKPTSKSSEDKIETCSFVELKPDSSLSNRPDTKQVDNNSLSVDKRIVHHTNVSASEETLASASSCSFQHQKTLFKHQDVPPEDLLKYLHGDTKSLSSETNFLQTLHESVKNNSNLPETSRNTPYFQTHSNEVITSREIAFPLLESSPDGFILKDSYPETDSYDMLDPLLDPPTYPFLEEYSFFSPSHENETFSMDHLRQFPSPSFHYPTTPSNNDLTNLPPKCFTNLTKLSSGYQDNLDSRLSDPHFSAFNKNWFNNTTSSSPCPPTPQYPLCGMNYQAFLGISPSIKKEPPNHISAPSYMTRWNDSPELTTMFYPRHDEVYDYTELQNPTYFSNCDPSKMLFLPSK